MTILSSINDWIVGWTRTFEQGPTTRPLAEWLIFLEGFPFSQVAGAALAEGTNVPLDIAAAMALLADINKAFFAGKTVQTAMMAVATRVGVAPVVAAQIVINPVPPLDPMQFSRGRSPGRP